nr:hypothetical protein [Tanacetum cinerariifolium]
MGKKASTYESVYMSSMDSCFDIMGMNTIGSAIPMLMPFVTSICSCIVQENTFIPGTSKDSCMVVQGVSSSQHGVCSGGSNSNMSVVHSLEKEVRGYPIFNAII